MLSVFLKCLLDIYHFVLCFCWVLQAFIMEACDWIAKCVWELHPICKWQCRSSCFGKQQMPRFHINIRVILLFNQSFSEELIVLQQYFPCLVCSWCMIGVGREVWTKTFYIGSLRMKRYRKFIIQTSRDSKHAPKTYWTWKVLLQTTNS